MLCAALCHEIQIYKTILQRAINLNASDYEQSLQELAATCPIQAARSHVCDNNVIAISNNNNESLQVDLQPPVTNWIVMLVLMLFFVLWKKKKYTTRLSKTVWRVR